MKECRAAGCAALPAVTAAKFPPDGMASARSASTQDGVLYVPHGYVAGLRIDPIEKKPFFHVSPGKQGAQLRHARLRLPLCSTARTGSRPRRCGIRWRHHAVELADGRADRRRSPLQREAPVITSTYNEPLITSEWAVEIFKLAKPYGIKCSYVSNGNGTPEVHRLHPPVRRLCTRST